MGYGSWGSGMSGLPNSNYNGDYNGSEKPSQTMVWIMVILICIFIFKLLTNLVL